MSIQEADAKPDTSSTGASLIKDSSPLQNKDELQPPPAKLPKSMQVRSRSRKSWKQCVSKGKRWIEKTSPCTPSFAFLYWRVDKRRSQMEWFEVQELFKSAALKTPLFKGSASKEGSPSPACLSYQPLALFSSNSTDYIADVLYLILPRIMNPQGVRTNFYVDQNKPTWFPADLPFIPPTHRRSKNQGKFNVKELQRIFQAFLDNCPDLYVIDPKNSPYLTRRRKAAPKKESPAPEDTMSDLASSTDQRTEGEATSYHEDGSPESSDSANVDNHSFDSINEMLAYVALSSGWTDLQKRVLSLSLLPSQVELVRVVEKVYLKSLPKNKLDTRFKNALQSRHPKGYYPVDVFGDGNCLFRAVSVALFGNEEQSTMLRLASVWQAVTHFDHYVKTYTTALGDVGEAHQFVNSVINSDEQFYERPQTSPTVEELVRYVLQVETWNTSQLGTYSGPLQVQYLAGATNKRIVQSHQLYTDMCGFKELYPCGCMSEENLAHLDSIHLMWIATRDDPHCLNHIIPLIPQNSRVGGTSKLNKFSVTFDSCLAMRQDQCAVVYVNRGALNFERTQIAWIACDSCGSWYHSICLGFCASFCKERVVYCTCRVFPSDRDEIAFDRHIGKYRFQASISDVRTLYPDQGLSDAIVDLYTKFVLSPSADTLVLGALSFTAICDVLDKVKGNVDLKRLKQRFRSASSFRPEEIISSNHGKVVFPCKLTHEWHWIAVIVVLSQKRAFVMDSMNTSELSLGCVTAVQRIEQLFQTVDESLNLTAHQYKVPLQSGVNCGLHALHNIHVATTHSSKDFLEGTIPASTLEVNPSLMRATLLTKCCEYNEEYTQASVNIQDKTMVLRSHEETIRTGQDKPSSKSLVEGLHG